MGPIWWKVVKTLPFSLASTHFLVKGTVAQWLSKCPSCRLSTSLSWWDVAEAFCRSLKSLAHGRDSILKCPQAQSVPPWLEDKSHLARWPWEDPVIPEDSTVSQTQRRILESPSEPHKVGPGKSCDWEPKIGQQSTWLGAVAIKAKIFRVHRYKKMKKLQQFMEKISVSYCKISKNLCTLLYHTCFPSILK